MSTYFFIIMSTFFLLLSVLIKVCLTAVSSKLVSSQKLYFLFIISSWEGKEVGFWKKGDGALYLEAKEQEGKGMAFSPFF